MLLSNDEEQRELSRIIREMTPTYSLGEELER